MNSIEVKVMIDTKAALLAGRVLNSREPVTITPRPGTPEWELIVSRINDSLLRLTVDDPTEDAVYAAASAEVIAIAKKAREDLAGQAAALGKLREMMADWTPSTKQAGVGISARGDLVWEHYSPTKAPKVIPNWYYADAAQITRSHPDVAEQSAAIAEEARKLRADAEAEVNRLNAETLNRDGDRIRAEHAAIEESRAAAQKAAQKAADEAAAEARELVKSGIWRHETGAYNHRRMGKPWCAKVDFSTGPKGDYEFGQSSASFGSAGLLELRVAPGDFIAWGQKDNRRGGGDHTVGQVNADGSVTEFTTKAEAYAAYKARSAK